MGLVLLILKCSNILAHTVVSNWQITAICIEME